jgi:hypothetical protein
VNSFLKLDTNGCIDGIFLSMGSLICWRKVRNPFFEERKVEKKVTNISVLPLAPADLKLLQIHLHWVSVALNFQSFLGTTLVIPISACYYSELCRAIMSYSGVQFSLTKAQ